MTDDVRLIDYGMRKIFLDLEVRLNMIYDIFYIICI